MKGTLTIAMAAVLASSSAFASARRHHEPHHRGMTAIEKLESEIAALRKKVDQIEKPQADWRTGVAIPFNAVASIGEAATQAALEVPEQIIVKPLAEISEAVQLASDRNYLVVTSCPGYTMERQGVRLSIERLHPTFAHRLAVSIREARAIGIGACVFSAYRPPAYGVGGFRDKFYSAHAYGLAVDLSGIGRPGSGRTLAWRRIASAHGIYGPYSAYSRHEWNHFQITPARMVTFAARGLRRTITARGPVSLQRMWRVADAIIPQEGKRFVLPREPRVARHRHHYALRHRRAAAR